MTDETSTSDSGQTSLSVSEAADAFGAQIAQATSEAATPALSEPETSTVEEASDAVEEVVEEVVEAAEAEDTTTPDTTPEAVDDNVEQDIFLIDGEEVSASDLEGWKKDGLREADYTRKTQALAEEKKQWEADRAEQEAVKVAEWEAKMSLFADAAVNELQAFEQTNWEQLEQDDPIEYSTQWTNYQRSLAKAQAVEKQIIEKQLADNEVNQAAQATYVSEQVELAKQAIPELSDPVKGPQLISDMSSYMVESGFSKQEIDSTTDARALQIVRDAMLYQALQKDTGKKVVTKTKVLRSGNTTPDNLAQEKVVKARAEEISNFRNRGGKVDDAAALFSKHF